MGGCSGCGFNINFCPSCGIIIKVSPLLPVPVAETLSSPRPNIDENLKRNLIEHFIKLNSTSIIDIFNQIENEQDIKQTNNKIWSLIDTKLKNELRANPNSINTKPTINSSPNRGMKQNPSLSMRISKPPSSNSPSQHLSTNSSLSYRRPQPPLPPNTKSQSQSNIIKELNQNNNSLLQQPPSVTRNRSLTDTSSRPPLIESISATNNYRVSATPEKEFDEVSTRIYSANNSKSEQLDLSYCNLDAFPFSITIHHHLLENLKVIIIIYSYLIHFLLVILNNIV